MTERKEKISDREEMKGSGLKVKDGFGNFRELSLAFTSRKFPSANIPGKPQEEDEGNEPKITKHGNQELKFTFKVVSFSS